MAMRRKENGVLENLETETTEGGVVWVYDTADEKCRALAEDARRRRVIARMGDA